MIAQVELPTAEQATQNAKYDDETREAGGFGAGNFDAKIEIKMKVKHEGEVNRARYNPRNHFVIATKGPQSEVYIYDLTKHPSMPAKDSAPAPQHVLRGHTAEGYGLAWDPNEPSGSGISHRLVSGGEDGKVCLWELTDGSPSVVDAKSIFTGHTDVVEDVAWHNRDRNLIGSVGDDRAIILWDMRKKGGSKPVHAIENAHASDINGIAFNPQNEFLFATSSADKTVALWDVRNLKSRVHSLRGHTDQVFQVEWCPFNETILGSCSADRRVNIWDLSRIGAEQTPEDAEDGPPELLFVHGGHTSKVSDFCWADASSGDSDNAWTVASIAEDNILQVWQMAEEIYIGDGDEEDDEKNKNYAELGKDELE